MNRILKIAISIIIICISLIACDNNTNEHIGEVKTQSASSIQKGKDYEEVINTLKECGFTSIQTEKIEDLKIGLFTKDGEVESVSIDWNINYSPDE